MAIAEKSSSTLNSDFGLTKSQLNIWIGQNIDPSNPLYNMTLAFTIKSKVNENRFRSAWQSCIVENKVLRSFISSGQGKIVLNFHPTESCSLSVLDFSHHKDPSGQFDRWSNDRASVALPLNGELVDSVLVKFAEEEYGWYLNQHHLVTDASSTMMLIDEVMFRYSQTESDQTQTPRDDYYKICRELERRNTINRRNARNYWEEKTSYPLKFFGKESRRLNTTSERLSFSMNEKETKLLQEVCLEKDFASFFNDLSLFVVFATLTVALLRRISGENNIGFDAPVHNRSTQQAKKSLGCFIELFPICVNTSCTDTFRDLASKLNEELKSYLLNSVPGSSLRDAKHSNQVVLNFFPQSFSTNKALPLTSNWLHSGHMDEVHDIRLQVQDYDGTGNFKIEFDLDCELFNHEKRLDIAVYFKRILHAFLKDRNTVIDDIDILISNERERLIYEYNHPSNNPTPTDTIIDRFCEQSLKTPEHAAIRHKDRILTFAQLSSSVDSFAHHLLQIKSAENEGIAIFMKRSPEVIIAILGVLQSGYHYIPIDTNYPSDRILLILKDSNVKTIISCQTLIHKLPTSSKINVIDFDNLDLSKSKNSPKRFSPSLSSLAYTIYTSGSTGNPKGVEIEHRGLIDYIDWAARQYLEDQVYSFPLFTSLSFDLTVTSLYLPLATGGTLIIYEETDGPVDSSLISVISDNAVQFIKLTPSHLSLLRQMDLSESRVEKMVLGGEDLKCELAGQISEQFQGRVSIFNEYGPTEAVVGCMIHKFDPKNDPKSGTSVPIGVPADHVKLYVLNDRQSAVPAGVSGELYIARNGLARGYRNNPEKTAQVFLENPFDENERYYRTGDLVRFNENGVLVYLGRTDNQLKISGHRIEPGEIEHALNSHPSISSSFVTAFGQRGSVNASATATHCTQCGLPSNYPNILFDEQGVCNVCQKFESIKDKAKAYFKSKESLLEIFDIARAKSKASLKYDCMMFYSGGKDSSYALCKLVDLGINVYAFTLDNGYISIGAKANISRVVENLGIDHEFASTTHMNRIFKDSLTRFSNVCNGCFKTIYTLGINRAHELGIPIIVTGLSRGQFFETRLTENLFKNGQFSPDQVDIAVLEARKAYHRTEDEVSRCLDVSLVQSDETFKEIQFVDFYRYWDVSLTELYAYLEERVPWIRPKDTGRSTNCVVNDVGIYIHNKERGYHNYALPYSWDVRMGHKERDEALDELDDKFEITDIQRMLSEIDYDEDRLSSNSGRSQLVGYYVSEEPIEYASLKRHLAQTLTEQLIPSVLIQLNEMPLTVNGKVNTELLPSPGKEDRGESNTFVNPSGPVEEHVADIWTELFPSKKIGANDEFFQLGGTSLSAMETILRLCADFEIDLPLQTIFQNPTISAISSHIEKVIMEEVDALSEEEATHQLKEKSKPIR